MARTKKADAEETALVPGQPTTIVMPAPDDWLARAQGWVGEVAATQGAVVVRDEAQAQTAARAITDLVAFSRKVVEERTNITAGAYKTIKAIEKRFRPVLEEIDETRKKIERGLLDFRQAEQQARAVALAQARALAPQVTDINAVRNYQALVAHGAANQETRLAGVHFKKTWRARVVNPGVVPANFWVIDQAALDAYAKQNEDRAFLPGVEFYVEENVGQVRTK